MKPFIKIFIALVVIAVMVGGYYYLHRPGNYGRGLKVVDYIRHPSDHDDWRIPALQACSDAPFLFPTDGYVGFLWDDSFRPGHQHQGIDIFAGTQPGETPVYAVYDGYLTRLSDWRSSVIIRVPSDPLMPGRQIWTYYTHMADQNGNSYIADEFPPGTTELPVQAGTLLGYQGDYSGDPNNPVGVHLHFSIVLDDGEGHFRNELEIRNTLDPSPYFNMNLNSHSNQDEIPACRQVDV
ncbi:MAG: M23 family metallopeptidase [Anaerolineae bacterium]|nr:M23 family metallopeptidase [Anaerolineae bacterium]